MCNFSIAVMCRFLAMRIGNRCGHGHAVATWCGFRRIMKTVTVERNGNRIRRLYAATRTALQLHGRCTDIYYHTMLSTCMHTWTCVAQHYTIERHAVSTNVPSTKCRGPCYLVPYNTIYYQFVVQHVVTTSTLCQQYASEMPHDYHYAVPTEMPPH